MKGNVLIIILVGVLVVFGLAAYFFLKTPPAVQAKELFTLYFEIDQSRTESGEMYAELLEVFQDPSRSESENGIGALPELLTTIESEKKLKKLNNGVTEALMKVNEKEFSDPDVKNAHSKMVAFYQKLEDLVEFTNNEMKDVDSDREFGQLVTILLEDNRYFPAVTVADKELTDSLTTLSSKYSIEFNPVPFRAAFTGKLSQVRTPIVSEEKGEIIYNFSVDGSLNHHLLVNVTGEVPFVEDDSFIFTNPVGKIIELPLYNFDSDSALAWGDVSIAIEIGPSARVFKFFPQDEEVQPLKGDWSLKINVRGGQKLVIGFTNL